MNQRWHCFYSVADSRKFTGRWVWRPRLTPGLVLLLSAWLGLEARAQSGKAPAEAVFSNAPAARVYSLTVPLVVGNQIRQDIRVILSTNREDLKLQAAPLLEELAPLLRPGAHSSKLVSNLSTRFSSNRFSRSGTYCPLPTLDSHGRSAFCCFGSTG